MYCKKNPKHKQRQGLHTLAAQRQPPVGEWHGQELAGLKPSAWNSAHEQGLALLGIREPACTCWGSWNMGSEGSAIGALQTPQAQMLMLRSTGWAGIFSKRST